MKLDKPTLRTLLIALDDCLEREQSVTAQLRISTARARVAEALMDYSDTPATSLATRTEDFTMKELFDHGGVVDECLECGAKVLNYGQHVKWHNKLLP
jgi:hypothetical protein